MRYLILFMFLVGIFIFGGRFCGTSGDGWHFGFDSIRGEGPVKTENRTVDNFHAVEAMIPGTVEVSVSDRCSVEVQAQENLLPVLKTEVTDGKLKIWFDKSVSEVKDLVIRVSAPSYDELALAGSGAMKVNSPLSGENLSVSISGSGELNLPQADVQKISCSIAGSGDMRIGGATKEASYQISGSGDIEAKELVAETGEAEIAGSGTVNCHVTQTLKASIAGSGDVFYKGSPGVDTDIAGSGKVKKVE